MQETTSQPQIDPRFQQIAGIVIGGIVDIFSKCMAVYQGGQTAAGGFGQPQHPQPGPIAAPVPPPPPPPPPPPQSVAIRPQNVPSAKAASIAASEMPPTAPDWSAPLDKSALVVPTWAQLINLYSECAAENFKRNFKPTEKVRASVITGIKAILKKVDVRLDEPYTALTRPKIRKLEDMGLKEGRSRATIQTWRGYLKSITAQWAVIMYEDRGWKVESIVTQPFNKAQKSYVALDGEVVAKIDAWVERLRQEAKTDPEARKQFKFIWLMRNLAIRNGDVFRYTWGNFTDRGATVHSSYIPNKTMNSSHRPATWDFSKEKWMEIGEFAEAKDALVVPVPENVRDEFQRELNRQIKEILPADRNKGLYELRKLSAHETYQKFGPKAAVRKTGDSFATLNVNYVDTSAGNDDEFD